MAETAESGLYPYLTAVSFEYKLKKFEKVEVKQ